MHCLVAKTVAVVGLKYAPRDMGSTDCAIGQKLCLEHTRCYDRPRWESESKEKGGSRVERLEVVLRRRRGSLRQTV